MAMEMMERERDVVGKKLEKDVKVETSTSANLATAGISESNRFCISRCLVTCEWYFTYPNCLLGALHPSDSGTALTLAAELQ